MKQASENSRSDNLRPGGRVARFGAFEADFGAEELRKNGIRIRLPAQPFRILALLLDNPGRIVTREELRRELWSADTFVDFDRCLNTAVNRLREALGDTAESPRYIQTIPRRGYRLLAPVETTGGSSPAARVGAGLPGPARMTRKRRTPLVVLLAAVTVLGVVAVSRLWKRTPDGASGPLRTAPLTSFSGAETTPSFSPDGAGVVYSWNGEGRDNFDIYVSVIGSATVRRLTSGPAEDFGPSFSPDGSQVAFYRRSGDSSAVYLISASGGRVARLLGLKVGPLGPSAAIPGEWYPELLAWSPTGKSVAFADKESPDGSFSILLRQLTETEEQRLTWPPPNSYGDGSPAFSPDGRTLAFVRRLDHLKHDIYTVSLTGGSPQRLTTDNRRIRGLAWTPDGRDIVFSSERSGQFNLWRIRASGGTPERLAGIGEQAMFPAVAPRGHRLAYVQFGSDRSIWRLRRG